MAAAALGAPPAAAADGWSITSFLSQRFEADSNLRLDPRGDGEAVGSTTTVGADFVSETPRTRFVFSPSLRGTLFAGDGSTPSQDLIAPQGSTRITHRVARFDLRGGLSFDARPTTFADIGTLETPGPTNLDLVNQDAIQLTLRGDAGLTYRINAANRLSLGTNVLVRRFTDDNDTLSPNTTVGVGLDYAHDVNSSLTTDFGANVRRVEIDGISKTENLVFGVDGGARVIVNPTLSFGARGGVSLINTSRENQSATTGLGFTGSGDLTYDARRDLTLSLTANQGIEPSSIGQLQVRSALNARAVYLINARERVDFGLVFSRQTSASTFDDQQAPPVNGTSSESRQIQASLGYEQNLTSDITGRIGYAVRRRLDEPNAATSHKVFLTISKSFSILP